MARPRSEAARQRVLDAAHVHIALVGVGKFTVDAVAKISGVAKTTIYRHWESGNHLLLDAMDCLIEQFATPNTGSLRADLIELYTLFLPTTEDPTVMRMMLGMLARSHQDDSFRKLKNEFMRQRHQPLRTVLELAQARGELRPELDLDIALDMVEGPFFAKRILRGEPMTLDAVEQYVDAIVYALAAPNASHPQDAPT